MESNIVQVFGDAADTAEEVLLMWEKGYLGLAIRSQPGAGAILPNLSEASPKLGCKNMAKGHEFRGLISGITKHMALVTSTNLLRALGEVSMDTLGNIRALLLNVNQNLAVVSIKTDIIRNKSNSTACVPNNLLIVYVSLGGDFSKDHDHVGLGACFTGDLAVRVLSKASVEHCIRDLVTQLVGVTLVDRFRCK
ncbi:hypothetical protein CFP56_009523 [Quercus suber]|uniref:Uncharacterized protein n=1 Tax=Quercus suber TaxID=58331 RepID=A0AAW0M6A6_QUESU